MSNSFDLNQGWRLNAALNGMSNSPTGLQGTTNGYVSTSFSISKELITNKLSLGARFNNPFVKYRNNNSTSFGKEF
ncbi:outer membrane beta-barrel protein [Pedobacter steynii]